MAHGTIFSAICEANFPTLVPPYFCTSHLALGSIVFWCMFGGVRGGGGDSMEGSEWAEAEEVGVDGSDMEFGAANGDAVFDSQGGGQRPCCAGVWRCGRESRIVSATKKIA